jgi:putative transposase
VLAYEDDDHTQVATGEVLGISRATLNAWLRLRRETGSSELRARPKRRRNRTIDEDKRRAYMAEHPDAYLWEIAEGCGVSTLAIFYACRQATITRKKTTPYARRDEIQRQVFQARVAQLNDHQILWVDECGVDQGVYRGVPGVPVGFVSMPTWRINGLPRVAGSWPLTIKAICWPPYALKDPQTRVFSIRGYATVSCQSSVPVKS